MTAGCPLSGWSAVTSAQANAALAAVLAGFMLNGIVLLLSNNSLRRNPSYVQALSLLFAAFVVLGLDAYLFGLVTGDTGRLTCRRAWTEAMYAAGLLGVGAVAIIAAFVFMLAVYVRNTRSAATSSRVGDDHRQNGAAAPGAPRGHETQLTKSLEMLAGLCNSLRGVVVLVVLVILYMTARSYLYSALTFRGTGYPAWIQAVLWIYLGAGIAAGVTSTVVIYNRKNKSAGGPKAADERLIDKLKAAIYWSLGYTIASVTAGSYYASLPVGFWNPTHFWPRLIIGGTAVWVLGVSLIPLWYLVIRLVPPFDEETRSDEHEPEQSSGKAGRPSVGTT